MLMSVAPPPGTRSPAPGIPAKNRADPAIQPVAQEATRAQALDMGGLIGASRAPDRARTHIPAMAAAFKSAIEAGRRAYLAGMGRVIDRGASASSPLQGVSEK